MKVLCVCEHGNNRSHHFAHPLKYVGHDVLTAGLETNSPGTLDLLFNWSDVILTTERSQIVPERYLSKVRLYDVGPDNYPRPMNKELYRKVKIMLQAKPL